MSCFAADRAEKNNPFDIWGVCRTIHQIFMMKSTIFFFIRILQIPSQPYLPNPLILARDSWRNNPTWIRNFILWMEWSKFQLNITLINLIVHLMPVHENRSLQQHPLTTITVVHLPRVGAFGKFTTPKNWIFFFLAQNYKSFLMEFN